MSAQEANDADEEDGFDEGEVRLSVLCEQAIMHDLR